MLTRPAGHEAKAEARKSDAEAEDFFEAGATCMRPRLRPDRLENWSWVGIGFVSRYRFSFFWSVIKSRYRFRYRFFKISRYRFRFSVFPLEPTIAYRITPSLTPYALPFPPNGVWALEFALQIAAKRDSDIVTIDKL